MHNAQFTMHNFIDAHLALEPHVRSADCQKYTLTDEWNSIFAYTNSMLNFDVSIESFSINSPWTDAKYQSKQCSYVKKRMKKNQPNTMAVFIVR